MIKLAPIFTGKLFNEDIYLIEEEINVYPMSSSCTFKRSTIDTSVLTSNETFNTMFSDELKSQLLNIYSQTNRMSISWSLKAENENNKDLIAAFEENGLTQDFNIHDINGSINILTPDELINRTNFEYLNRNGEEYFPFDSNDTLVACFKKTNNKVEDNIYIFNVHTPDKVESMELGCEEYLRLAADAKLFNKWQYAYLDKQSQFNKLLNSFVSIIFDPVNPDLSNFN